MTARKTSKPTAAKSRVVSKKQEDKAPDTDNAEGGPSEPAVRPLDPKAFQLVMSIIDNAQIRGADANNILQLRMELARVANVRQASGNRP